MRTLCLLLPLFCLTACQPTAAPNAQTPPPPPLLNAPLHLLVFKAEGQIEAWQEGEQWVQLGKSEVLLHPKLPIGEFEATVAEPGRIQLAFPNDYYARKGGDPPPPEATALQLSDDELSKLLEQFPELRLIVFPSDARNGRPFRPCFACPHWTAELYSHLGRELRKYPLPLNTQPQ
ncbi:MAG: hypothetical protein AAGG75_19430 [Bacteroidota bacterium]